MADSYTLGVDFGGSSSKATLLDRTGRIVATSTAEYPCRCEHPGWSEYDADDLYKALVFNIGQCLKGSGISPRSIAAVALDAATHMAVFCGADDRPLRPIIHWADSRSTAQAEYLKKDHGALLKERTVNFVNAAWTLPQILWLNEHEPDIIRRAKRVYFAKDYVRHMLTGDFCTDSIEAMGAMLVDDRTGKWDRDLCALAGLDMSALPEIKAPTDIAGYVSEEASRVTGLAAGTPVLVGTTDTVLEVYASGAIHRGCGTVKLATAGRICPITDRAIDNYHFFNYRHIIPGLWYPGTTSRTCAASYKWYRDVFCGAESELALRQGVSAYEILNREAEKVPAGCDGLFFHPYLLGELTPYYDDRLRASFTGASMFHGKGHFSRAVMEGISYSMRDCLEEIRAEKITVDQYRVIGGGAKGRLWRQILCDVLDTPLTVTADNDSSLGSAMLAGVAAGIFDSFEDSVDKCVKVSAVVRPVAENVETYDKGFATYREIQAALAPVYHKIF